MVFQNSVNRQMYIAKLEIVICTEAVLEACYQALAGMVHNHGIRKECWRFERYARHRQEELRRIFPVSQESETAIENRLYEYLLLLKHPDLFLGVVLNLAINLTEQKIGIYRYLYLKEREHRGLLNQFIEGSREEMDFLGKERNFHQSGSAQVLKEAKG